MTKAVLDPCCGSRMFWFDKTNTRAIFGDQRQESHVLCDGRSLVIDPDVLLDFRALPFDDNSFPLVVFDPPHLVRAGNKSWLAAKYGRLSPNWRDDIRAGFSECFRVLKPDGVLIFKWNETQIAVGHVLALTEHQPLFGNKKPQQAGTHWLVFIK